MIDLVAVAHGTADPRGIRTVRDLVREMAVSRPEIPMSLGFVDVQEPALPGLVSRVVADSNQSVLVPLLLSSGYHVGVDIGREVVRRPGQVVAAPALGPSPVLADVLVDRLGDLSGIDSVVLAAAGSSDRAALLDCSATAALLGERLGRSVEVGYISGAGERLGPVIARTPGRVAVATYLLAPGFFADRAARIAGAAGAVRCSAPLGADRRIAQLALQRYDLALASTTKRRVDAFCR
ncbi:sirohydrochlorin chelatase [Kribbella deserti]|uniref:Sirohydrochlorin chelatase n=1 Tax=Kribbella deserti TaxID=1926257 RepID=A0ABV6QRX8_9ACTN